MNDPVPALLPLRDKPLHAIDPGSLWGKIASGKTSVNRPICRIISFDPTLKASVCASIQVGGRDGLIFNRTERVFRRDWEPL